MRNLASIQKVRDKKSIPKADKIEVVMINGWEVITKKDEFQIGDLVVYIEIDSLLPEREEFEFLRSRKFKVKTIKLKGQVSQGIVFSTKILPKMEIKEGVDVTSVLNIKNYKDDEEIKDPVKPRSFIMNFLMRFHFIRKFLNSRKSVADFPSFIKKTDEPRIQNIPHFFDDLWRIYTTEKLDGQSATFFVKPKKYFGVEFGVCSRNNYLRKDDNSNWWQIAKKYKLKQKMQKMGDYFYIQGEIVGPGIQQNKYKLTEKEFYLFNAYWPIRQQYATYKELVKIASQLGCKVVPSVNINLNSVTVPEIIEQSKGYSLLNQSVIREGIVIREDDIFVKNSVKAINPDFLLKNDE